MEDVWYNVIRDEEYCSKILGIFCELHDYVITDINYNVADDIMIVHLEVDDGNTGVLLKFIEVKDFNLFVWDRDNRWLLGSMLRLSKENTLVWCNVDDIDTVEKIKADPYILWIEAKTMHFAWLNKDKQIIPLTEKMLNPVSSELNYETWKYENHQQHYNVFEVRNHE